MGDTLVRPGAGRSPSGLLTRAAWEQEVSSSYERMPRWFYSKPEKDRQFMLWVHAEARGMASQLERMVRFDTEPALADHIQAVAEALRADAEWARQQVDGRFEGAA